MLPPQVSPPAAELPVRQVVAPLPPVQALEQLRRSASHTSRKTLAHRSVAIRNFCKIQP
jgi:hypothetical protein